MECIYHLALRCKHVIPYVCLINDHKSHSKSIIVRSAIGIKPYVHPRHPNWRRVDELEKDLLDEMGSFVQYYRCVSPVACKINIDRECSMGTGFISDLDTVMVATLKLVK